MYNNLEALKALLIVRDYSSRKTFKAIKIFDAAFEDDSKQDFLKKDLNKPEEFYKLCTVIHNDVVHTVLFEMLENQETVYYHKDLSLSSGVAFLFIESGEIEFVHIEKELFSESDFKNNNDSNICSEAFSLCDLEIYYEKAKDDIESSLKLFEKIKAQIETLDEEWQWFDFDFEYKGKTHSVKIPKLAYIFYVLDVRYAVDTLDDYNIPNWKCVSSSGWKCDGDNPYHTDFWVGCGFPFITAYPRDLFGEEDNFYSAFMNEVTELKYEIQDKYWNFRSNSVGAKKKVSGDVLHFDKFKDDFSKVEPDSIIILPHLGVEYEQAMFNALKNGKGGVISEEGGRTSHIAILGREMEFPIFIERNALKKYRWIKRAVLDGINKKIKVTPM